MHPITQRNPMKKIRHELMTHPFFVFLGAFFNCYSLYFSPQETYFLTFLHFFLNFEPKNFRTYNKICIFAPSNEKNTGFRK